MFNIITRSQTKPIILPQNINNQQPTTQTKPNYNMAELTEKYGLQNFTIDATIKLPQNNKNIIPSFNNKPIITQPSQHFSSTKIFYGGYICIELS